MITPVTISAVIPCYNAEGFVDRAVRSMLEQTYPLEEVICVDDGSTDGTLEVLKGIQQSGGGITIHAQENQGICGARNVGLERTTGDYIAFLDQDDQLTSGKIEHQVQLIEQSSVRPDFVAAAYKEVFPDEDREPTVRTVDTSDPWLGLIHARLGRTSSNLWWAEGVREVGAWQEEDGLSLDTGLMFRMMKSGAEIIGDREPRTVRYTLNVSASRKNRPKQWSTFLEMRRRIFDYLESSGKMTPERKAALHVDMMTAARGLYEHDRERALTMHEEVVRPRFETPSTSFGPGRFYRILYRMLGFRQAERLYPLWLRARDALSGSLQGQNRS